MDWHWNGSLTAGTAGNPAQIDLYNAAGVKLTDNGLTGYNTGFGGFDRHYALDYKGDAPYASLNYENDHVDLDASARYDNLHATGNFYQTAATTTSLDVNGDGVLSVAEQNVYLNSGVAQKVDYSVNYFSWSFGANYRFDGSTSIFARVSEGHRANADRLLGNGPGYFNADGSSGGGRQAGRGQPGHAAGSGDQEPRRIGPVQLRPVPHRLPQPGDRVQHRHHPGRRNAAEPALSHLWRGTGIAVQLWAPRAQRQHRLHAFADRRGRDQRQCGPYPARDARFPVHDLAVVQHEVRRAGLHLSRPDRELSQ